MPQRNHNPNLNGNPKPNVNRKPVPDTEVHVGCVPVTSLIEEKKIVARVPMPISWHSDNFFHNLSCSLFILGAGGGDYESVNVVDRLT